MDFVEHFVDSIESPVRITFTEGDKDMTDTMTKNIDTDSPEPPEEAFAFMRPKPRRARITLKKTK